MWTGSGANVNGILEYRFLIFKLTFLLTNLVGD